MYGTIALVSTALASFAAAAPISTESHSQEVFGNFTASFWWDGSYTGSCGYTNSTKQYIASIRNANASLDSACGKTINITDLDVGLSVLAMVVDEVVDAPENYLNVSRVTFQNVTDLETSLFNASYVFVDAPVPEWTPPADEQDEDEDDPVHTPKKQEHQQQAEPTPKATPAASPKQQSQQPKVQKQQQQQQQQQPKTTSSSRKVEQQKQYTPTSSSKKQEYTPKTTPKQAAYTPKTTPKQAEYTPKTTPKKEVYTPKTTSKKVVETPKQASSGGGQFSGRGTWYTQNGNAGACGAVNSDSAYIVAINSAQYAGGSHCGKSVRISANGRSITARVADMCPGCPYGGLDLSTGAFQALGSLSQGVLSLSWSWA